MKTILPLVTLACLLLSGVEAAEPSPVSEAGTNQPLSADAVVREVLERNPALKSARANWEAMKTRIRQSSAWADPKFGVDVERSDSTRFFSYSDTEWMIAQEIPISGKNRLRAAGAKADAFTAFAELRRREVDLEARARIACVALANAYKQLELNQRNEALLKQVTEIARIRYESGMRMQGDVLMAQTELVKNQEARRDLERDVSDAQSRINTLMDRPANNPLPAPGSNAFRDATLLRERVEQVALQHRPELAGASNRIASAKAQHTLARRAWIPDPEVRVEARQFDGSGFIEYDTGIFFNLPWFNFGKYKSAIAEAGFNRESAEHNLSALQAETAGQVRDQLQKISTAHHHYSLFRERLSTLARQSLDATRIAYENDKSTLLELLTAQRTLREVESTQERHLADYLSALAELEAITGANLQTLTKP